MPKAATATVSPDTQPRRSTRTRKKANSVYDEAKIALQEEQQQEEKVKRQRRRKGQQEEEEEEEEGSGGSTSEEEV